MNLNIRLLGEDDFQDVIKWRSDPTTMRMSKYTGEVSKEGFKPVFKNYLTNNLSYMICQSTDKICFITINQIDQVSNVYEIGINMNPDFRGKKMAKPCLELFLDHIETQDLKDNIKISMIHATIRQENIASIKLFTSCNFNQIISFEAGYHKYLYICNNK